MMATTSAVSAAAKAGQGAQAAQNNTVNASRHPDVSHARPDAKHLPKRQVTLAMQC